MIITIIIIIVIIIFIVLLTATLIQSSAKSFTWDLRQMKGGMPHHLEGKILAGNYIIRDSSMFTYIESTFPIMWAVLVSNLFCISYSDGLPGMVYHVLGSNYTWNCFGQEFPHFCNLSLRSLYLESSWNSLRGISLSARTVTSIMMYSLRNFLL